MKTWLWIGLSIAGVAAVLRQFGTASSVADARDIRAAYELVGAWDGADFPSGKLDRPMGIAVAPSGDVYVSDARKRVVHLDSRGDFVGQWGAEGNGEGEFSNPVGIAVAPDGSVYVTDYDQDRVQKFTPDGGFLLAFGSSGKDVGQFDAPAAVTVDRDGFVYVADFYNHRIQEFRADGSFEQVIGHAGRLGDGALHYPTGVTVGPDGTLVVADAYNYQIQRFSVEGRPLERLGRHLLWLWPRPSASNAGFNVPTGVAVGPDGLVHVADSGNHRIVMLSESGGYITDWPIPEADPAVHSPEQIAVSPDGRTIYATDYAANRIIVLRLPRAAEAGASQAEEGRDASPRRPRSHATRSGGAPAAGWVTSAAGVPPLRHQSP